MAANIWHPVAALAVRWKYYYVLLFIIKMRKWMKRTKKEEQISANHNTKKKEEQIWLDKRIINQVNNKRKIIQNNCVPRTAYHMQYAPMFSL